MSLPLSFVCRVSHIANQPLARHVAVFAVLAQRGFPGYPASLCKSRGFLICIFTRSCLLTTGEQAETLATFEFTNSSIQQPHSILFVGGLGDGLATTSYLADVVRGVLPTSWSLFTLNLTSSYNGWGQGHLDRDTDEIAKCIQYIQEYKKEKYGQGSKIVLMGHSTGSQCVLHYLSRSNPHTSRLPYDPDLEHIHRPVLDGAIMQAPVSDRQAVMWVLEEGFLGKTPAELKAVYDELVATAKAALAADPASDAILPIAKTSQLGYFGTPISCRRFLSLVSPDSPESPSEDDLFSSDLSDAQLAATFGMVGERGLLRGKLVVLMSGADQAVPDWVDKEGLLARWKKVADTGGKSVWHDSLSGIIPGASHALSNDDQAEPRRFLVGRILEYLRGMGESE